jgi:hypothetical protein
MPDLGRALPPGEQNPAERQKKDASNILKNYWKSRARNKVILI